ncbi:DNA-3-methyladenine glycosylase [Mangrovibacillus cuniculi]|uniref:Putative 3-methyladenine DNA glycosylase n=1 Tax=Mangrovibacillus cuniculi TaxID=2593652 RepID=A0A7S8HGH5_9BACI|nr:DNA-3-methyladenine glycosylase [Mangrovibacillus cuniculi]QPC47812.1 DNA-3-methyladenine glycosylase [Mangrovibacillus cuniculi]
MEFSVLRPCFYEKPTIELAQELIGKLLVKKTDEETLVARIVETEAYLGTNDRAAHSFGNRRTKRTDVMFGPPGYIYTYLMHTHCLINVVGGQIDQPEAVLIRAVEPIAGMEEMQKRRGSLKRDVDVTNGPGKLTKAMGITMEVYGEPCWGENLFIANGEKPSSIMASRRIGIDGSGEAVDYLYRFTSPQSRFVSGTKKQNNGIILNREEQ